MDHHLEEKVSLLLPFRWWSVHSVLQSGENPWSNSGHWAFHGTTYIYISHWQFLFFSTSHLWVKSIQTSPAKLQAALLSVWFCQSLTTAMAFCLDCHKNRLNIDRQCKMLLRELSWNAKNKKTKNLLQHSNSYTASLAPHPETDLRQNYLCYLPVSSW